MAPQTQMTPDSAQRLIDAASETDKAKIFKGTTDHPDFIQEFYFALDKATGVDGAAAIAQKIGKPWKSIYVADASDFQCYVYVQPGSADAGRSRVKLTKQFQLNSDWPISEAYIGWDAQPGKWLKLLVASELQMTPGVLVTLNTGGVQVFDGSISNQLLAGVSVGTVAVQILPQDSTRSSATLTNLDGAPVYLGDANVTGPSGAYPGVPLNAGERCIYKNPAALYGIVPAGANIPIGIFIER